jgi:hypothetical protein
MAPTVPRTMFAVGHQAVMAWTLSSVILVGVAWVVVLLAVYNNESDVALKCRTPGLVESVKLVGRNIAVNVSWWFAAQISGLNRWDVSCRACLGTLE